MNENLKRINAECFNNAHKEGKQVADAVIRYLSTQNKEIKPDPVLKDVSSVDIPQG